jgi:signal transduction histidine kinase/DNA-binding response OmpR family regulator/tetratricopeptide (TPR) repeat protein
MISHLYNRTLKSLVCSILFIFLLTPYHSALAQLIKSDSIKSLLRDAPIKDTLYLKNLISLAINTRNENIMQSKQYFAAAISLADSLSDIKHKIRALNGMGISHGMLDEYADAIRFFNEARSLAIQYSYPLYAGDSNNSLGIVYKGLGDYPESLLHYSKALQLYDSLHHETSAASCYENMGILFDLMKEPAEAMKHYEKALAIHQKTNDLRKLTIVNSNVALLYLQTGEYSRAIDIGEKNLAYYAENNLKRYKATEAVNLGYAYYKAKRYSDAEHHLLNALREAKELGLQETLFDALYSLSKLRADMGEGPAAIKLARDARAIADSTDSFTKRSKSHELSSYVYEKAGDIQQSLAHLKMHNSFEDSVFNESKAMAYKRQQVLMEVYNKDRQIEKQSLQLALLDKQIAMENKWTMMLGLALTLLLFAGFLYYQKYRTRIRHSVQLEIQNKLIKDQKEEIETINQQLHEQIVLRKETDDTINYFATSLFGKNSIEEILWDVAKNCIARLGLVDCVIYLLDESRNILVQKAAYGTKNPEHFQIHDPIEIPLGSGIVGAVARTGVAEIVNDTTNDPRYIVDDEARKSELAVPLIIHDKIIGVIDTEHPEKNFYTQYHLDSLTTIASICASKISQAEADEKEIKAREAQREADQIKQLDQLKSRFFANISHEFRTPLNLILAPLEKKESLSVTEMEMMSRNARRLLRLVNQLLDLAKIEVGLLKPEVRYINVFHFVSEIANSFMLMADAKDIVYRIGVPASDHVGYFDPDKLEKIVYNLLSNAFKFTPRGGSVAIDVNIQPDRTLCIVVGDSGIGIPKDVRDKIFTRFYQVDGSETRAYEGSGIGLALTKELVDLLNGTIAIDEAEETGCVFTVKLPPWESSVDDRREIVATEIPNYYAENEDSGRNEETFSDRTDRDLPVILMVEDNNDLRTYVKSRLGNSFIVLTAKNGEEGITIARQKIPDLIVTDIMMPVMDGVTLTKLLREDEKTSHIPIVLLTARDDGETKIKAFETGAEQYVVKPFEISELIARINGLLSQRERLRKRFGSELTLKPSDVVLSNRDAEFLERIIKIIEQHINQESFSVEQLQLEIGMSRMQLHRKLKALTNLSASDFIRSIKLKRAAQILKQPGIQIAEAAYLSGFNHMSYFSKCFKEQFGILPSEYAKQTVDT